MRNLRRLTSRGRGFDRVDVKLLKVLGNLHVSCKMEKLGNKDRIKTPMHKNKYVYAGSSQNGDLGSILTHHTPAAYLSGQ